MQLYGASVVNIHDEFICHNSHEQTVRLRVFQAIPKIQYLCKTTSAWVKVRYSESKGEKSSGKETKREQ